MFGSLNAPAFSRLFFSMSLHQQFNRKGWEFGFESDETEPGIRKYLRIADTMKGKMS